MLSNEEQLANRQMLKCKMLSQRSLRPLASTMILLELFLAGRANGLLMDANLAVMAVLALAALVVCVGATNVYNFMDGINGITDGYSGVVLLSVLMADAQLGVSGACRCLAHCRGV